MVMLCRPSLENGPHQVSIRGTPLLTHLRRDGDGLRGPDPGGRGELGYVVSVVSRAARIARTRSSGIGDGTRSA